MKRPTLFALLVIVTFVLWPAKLSAGNLLFILDASGSMNGQIDGRAKMQIARRALSKLIGDLPSDSSVGLMTYGHRVSPRAQGACSDIQLLVPIAKDQVRAVTGLMSAIEPRGKTPIAGSLALAPAAFRGHEGGNNNIVLISDGIETCDGDPCAIAGKLRASNIQLRVHVVGFSIADKDKAQLECIAEQGGGEYFSAASTTGFRQAVDAAVRVAQVAPQPQSPKPQMIAAKSTIYFADQFDGQQLGKHWEVVNPDSDSFIVENGYLNVLISEEKTLLSRIDDLKNVFRLSKPLPPGDWTITMRFKPSVATFREVISLALHTDKDHFLAASALVSVAPHAGLINVKLLGRKVAAGKATDFTKDLFWANTRLGHRNLATETQKYTDLAAKELHAMTLRIRKVGRSYHIAGKVEGDGTQLDAQSKWLELDKLTSLRAPGKSAVIAVGQAKHRGRNESIRGGETLINIDWIKIEKQ